MTTPIEKPTRDESSAESPRSVSGEANTRAASLSRAAFREALLEDSSADYPAPPPEANGEDF